jgi:hypothetical protein
MPLAARRCYVSHRLRRQRLAPLYKCACKSSFGSNARVMATAVSSRPAVRLEFSRRPSALRYMAAAFLPSPGRDPQAGCADLSARWCGHRASERELAGFLAATGSPGVQARQLPLLYPHTIGFRLQMAILTRPVFPVPIWRVLQVRNHLLQHRTIDAAESLDFETSVEGHRFVDKGLEVDLGTRVKSAGTLVWESLNTFYVRGRFGAAQPDALLARTPEIPREEIARWHMASSARLRFGFLTGDYNGLHLWSPYARRLGFEAAFFHSQRVLGHCLARLDIRRHHPPLRLDAWLKGPVYYGSDVRLCASFAAKGATFALFSGAEERPAMVGRIQDPDAECALRRPPAEDLS